MAQERQARSSEQMERDVEYQLARGGDASIARRKLEEIEQLRAAAREAEAREKYGLY